MGRPRADDPEARAKILAAAEELFAEQGFAGVGIRQIAAAAGVNGAMIHYYFTNKEGLYLAVMETAAATVRSLIADSVTAEVTLEERLTRFAKGYAAYIFGHPHLARILAREMLSGGAHFMKILPKYAPTNYAMLRLSIEEGRRRGELRDIDVELAPISLIGMIVIFQLMRPIISLAIGNLKYDDAFVERLAAHTVDLFLNGAAAPGRTSRTGNPADSGAPREANTGTGTEAIGAPETHTVVAKLKR